MENDYAGVLFIGDPHLASRAPGFRKDDYPKTILAKVAWCLEYAREQRLLPAILGDVFHQPRDNSNWLLGELLAILGRQPVIALYGNHDCRENALSDNDSLSVIIKSGRLVLVDETRPWIGMISGKKVVVGGTSWGKKLPREFGAAGIDGDVKPTVFWMAHHDVRVPGFEEEGYFDPFEIRGVNMVVNGHIHRSLADVRMGNTRWITPGSITRVARSDLSRQHVPVALKITYDGGDWRWERITIPHAPFDEVFHAEVISESATPTGSAFVQGLAELQARRTASAAGLEHFLKLNDSALEPAVREEIWALFKETMNDEHEAV